MPGIKSEPSDSNIRCYVLLETQGPYLPTNSLVSRGRDECPRKDKDGDIGLGFMVRDTDKFSGRRG